MADWAFVALGSNLGDRSAHLAFARQRLAALPQTTLVAASAIEETAPLGPVPQGPYLNQMVLLSTELEPRQLLAACAAIERAAGRERAVRWGPRTLDLDLVRYDDLAVTEPELVVPHPELPRRPFWQRELAELMPHAEPR
ncbi:MAG: 2-amino-4-hydroxy-6-hydroxymethyldihydropteridine diphosphokinase [Gemmatimonadetes bacterium]|nr:2-amino-4-hydroxy-6-hydroxymethyldihydropteridine diphosphokinase [Gemmatimonadota bacterium]MBI2535603.1 2-amino-4-hydroxy-6-hydroxymethyldihydropteridine diphosphokinase [Gemmatimonadota bacterium]